jgi:hypothetical protein
MYDHRRCTLDRKKITQVGLILLVGGIMLCFDGIGSMLAEFNTHNFWSDLERFFRTVGGVLLVFLGIYIYRNAD